ncbi:hypothetical protein AC1031_009953 [Aphanomyces cochlioides]|nr:hypothetical protein AC1031_009953 [Aphanomyces cochlioides]
MEDQSAQQHAIYIVHLVPSLRNFKGQSSGTVLEQLTVEASSVDHFKELVTTTKRSQLGRPQRLLTQQTSTNLSYSIPLEEDLGLQCAPDPADIDKFVLFYPPSKRTLGFNALSSTILQAWLNKCVNLHVHRYSNSVSSKQVWLTVEHALILPAERDRAGAATTAALLALKTKPKTTHKDTYRSQDINWHMWAAQIQASEPHLQESMVAQAPPAHLIHLFAHAPEDPEVENENVRRGLAIAVTMNESFAKKLAGVGEIFNSLKRKHGEMERLLQAVESQINSSHDTTQSNSALLEGVESAIVPNDNEYGQAILHQIEDVEDVDHI